MYISSKVIISKVLVMLFLYFQSLLLFYNTSLNVIAIEIMAFLQTNINVDESLLHSTLDAIDGFNV